MFEHVFLVHNFEDQAQHGDVEHDALKHEESGLECSLAIDRGCHALQGLVNIMERVRGVRGRVGSTKSIHLQVLIEVVHRLSVSHLEDFDRGSGGAHLWLVAAKYKNLCKLWVCG